MKIQVVLIPTIYPSTTLPMCDNVRAPKVFQELRLQLCIKCYNSICAQCDAYFVRPCTLLHFSRLYHYLLNFMKLFQITTTYFMREQSSAKLYHYYIRSNILQF